MKILGREPALWIALIASLVSLTGAFVVHLSIDQMGALNGVVAALGGIAVWRATSDGLSALILGLVKSIILMGAAWNFNLDTDRQAILMTSITGIVAMFVRTQASALVPPPADIAQPVVVVDTPVGPATSHQ